MTSWQALDQELQQWQQPIALWWRDDDAHKSCQALDRLLTLAERYQAPCHLAVVPNWLEESLLVLNEPRYKGICYVLQHGIEHQSYALEGQRKVELGGSQAIERLLEKLATAREQLMQAFPQRYLDMLVPPWNRLDDNLKPQLAELGYQRLSVLKPRHQQTGEITQLNVHLDIINWRERRFAGDEAILTSLAAHLAAKRRGEIDSSEPCGLMTHHLDHDEQCWDFIERFLVYCQGKPQIQWLAGNTLLTL